MEGLEEKLVLHNWINNEQLNLARQDAARSGKSVWVSLVKLGYISEEDIAIFFAQESGINYVRISDYEINSDVVRLLNEDYCRQNSVIPLFKVKDILFIACANPFDAALMDSLTKLSGGTIELLIASRRSIAEALDLYWGPEERVFDFVKLMFKQSIVQGLGFWRESERLNLKIPASLKVEDKSIALHYSSAIEGYTCNISHNGTAIGLEVFLFLPKGIKVSLDFKADAGLSDRGQIIKARGEVVYCRIEKGERYFVGIRFIEIEDAVRRELFKLAGHT